MLSLLSPEVHDQLLRCGYIEGDGLFPGTTPNWCIVVNIPTTALNIVQ